MLIMNVYAISVLGVCALCTFAERALPFALFSKGKIPEFIKYLGKVLDVAVMTALVVFCVGTPDFSKFSGTPAYLLAIAVTSVIHIWRKNALLSIICGTVFYMVIIRISL